MELDWGAGGRGNRGYHFMGTECLFAVMKGFGHRWWWRLHNAGSVPNAAESLLENG